MVTDTWFRQSVADHPGIADKGYLLDPAASEEARHLIESWSFYRRSPLRHMDGLASHLGVAKVLALDDSQRLPLKSFKLLGAVYAAAQAVARGTHCGLSAGEVFDTPLTGDASDPVKTFLNATRLVAASDGNHGRALAWAAGRLGMSCSIYLPANVSPGREQRIRDYGAETIRIAGTYDQAVSRAHKDAVQNGWIIIQDTALEGFEEYCFDIMHGYTLLAHEACEQLGLDPISVQHGEGRRPTHVFVQAGVGGFAGATASYLASRFGADRPEIVVVESVLADCVMASLRNGTRTSVGGTHDTKMVGIACGEVSEVAWKILSHLTDYAVAIDDQQARQTLLLVAKLEPDVEIGETGVAGLAAIHALCRDADLRSKFNIDKNSVLLAFITEGITDQDSHKAFILG
jgi:diaminopropionate ammonia-lyase